MIVLTTGGPALARLMATDGPRGRQASSTASATA